MAERFLGYERDELDRQYDLLERHADTCALFHRLYETLSDKARTILAPELDVAYGESPRMRMDLYPARGPGAPVVGFLSGGYWKGRDKRDASFVALGLQPHGCAVAVIDHDRLPGNGLDDMVGQIARAALWLRANAGRLNGDPDRIVLAGHAAGGHLAAMMLTVGWDGIAGEPTTSPVAAIAAISGLFDLEAIRHCFLNIDLQLDAAAAARLSPLRLVAALRRPAPDVLLAVGEQETDEFHRNMTSYAGALDSVGIAVEATTVPGHHHFSLLAELADPSSRITKRLAAMALRHAAEPGHTI
jgi:arylformamidase